MTGLSVRTMHVLKGGSGKSTLRCGDRSYPINKHISRDRVDIFHVAGLKAKEPCIIKGRQIFVMIENIREMAIRDILPILATASPSCLTGLPEPQDLEKGQLGQLLLYKQFHVDSTVFVIEALARFVGEHALVSKNNPRLSSALAKNLLASLTLFNTGKYPFLALVFLLTDVIKEPESPEVKAAIKILIKLSLSKQQRIKYDLNTEAAIDKYFDKGGLNFLLKFIGMKVIKNGGPAAVDPESVSAMFSSFTSSFWSV
ncbi:MAG: hypothetical protein HQ564_02670 [Candidatus Saganbacteria bacterium]|nr:hypothetical protein [Candidatus Saganbacteria bacterium]